MAVTAVQAAAGARATVGYEEAYADERKHQADWLRARLGL
jgi:hypothetical protein